MTEVKVRYNAWKFTAELEGYLISQVYSGFKRKDARLMFGDLVRSYHDDIKAGRPLPHYIKRITD